MSKKIKVKFKVNGEQKSVEAYPIQRLVEVLRDSLDVTGVKEGCSEGECGACSIMLDGKLVNSCLVPVAQVENSEVITVEGLAKENEVLNKLQQAFLKCGGAQCGFCTPGMLMASTKYLEENNQVTLEGMKEALGGNFCRCTGYMKIFDSIEEAHKMEGAQS